MDYFNTCLKFHQEGNIDEAEKQYRNGVKINNRQCMLNLVSILSQKNTDESKREALIILQSIDNINKLNYFKIHTINPELFNISFFWYGTHKFHKSSLKTDKMREQWENVWFAKGDLQKKIDTEMTKLFSHLYDEKKLCSNCSNIHEDIALIILYDQMPRNIFRGTSKAYFYDSIALEIANKYINNIYYVLSLPLHYSIQLILCLIHSESIVDQNYSLQIISELEEQYKFNDIIKQIKKIAENHKLRIELFGRIPERNILLGRKTTECEHAFMNAL